MAAKKTYKEKLLDPRWQKKRLRILERDNWKCQHCWDTGKTLHVHHLDYINGRDPWEYPDSHLMTLCCDCHESMPSERAEYERQLIHNFRLKATCPYDMHTVTAVFAKHEDLAYLFYLINYTLRHQDEVIQAIEPIKERIEEELKEKLRSSQTE